MENQKKTQHLITDTHDSVKDSHDSITDINDLILDIVDLIMAIHNCVHAYNYWYPMMDMVMIANICISNHFNRKLSYP